MEICANAFLLHMVRNIARGLHDLGVGDISEVDLKRLLTAKDRTLLGATAPPQGLYLTDVDYPDFEIPKPMDPWF